MTCKSPPSDEEIWKEIPGYEGIYSASNKGRIKSLERYIDGPRGKRRIKEKIMSIHTRTDRGYCHSTVKLTKNKKPKPFSVHRLIALTFLGPCPDGMEVLHGINGPHNNSLDNLRYGTREENTQDMYEHRKIKKEFVYVKLCVNDVLSIVEMLDQGINQEDIAKKFNISQASVSKIDLGETWHQVTHRKVNRTHRSQRRFETYLQNPDKKWGKLSVNDVKKIKRMINDGEKNIDISKMFDVSPESITDIKKGRRWSFVNEDDN